MSQKLDRRKQYTRMVLKDSLMNLLKEKPITSITVKEICELANINRSTYYSHYSDQYDLLYKIEEEIIDDMNETLGSYNFTETAEALILTEKILEYVANHRNTLQTLLSEHGDTSFQNRVMNIVSQYMMKRWINANQIDKEVSEYTSIFIISGSIHVIKTWLENNMNKSPKEMAEMINNIINKGLASLHSR